MNKKAAKVNQKEKKIVPKLRESTSKKKIDAPKPKVKSTKSSSLKRKAVAAAESKPPPEVVNFLHVAWSPLPSKCLFMTCLDDGRIAITYQQLSKVC